MPRLSLIKLGAETPPNRQLSLIKLAADGTTKAMPRLSLINLTADGTVVLTVTPPADQTVEPQSTVTLTASLPDGKTADSWTWRQISGDTAGIHGTGATVTLTAPANISGTTLVIGVRATAGSTTSSEKTVTITVLPQIRWILDSSRTWQPLGQITLL